jgi:hypothetical protein
MPFNNQHRHTFLERITDTVLGFYIFPRLCFKIQIWRLYFMICYISLLYFHPCVCLSIMFQFPCVLFDQNVKNINGNCFTGAGTGPPISSSRVSWTVLLLLLSLLTNIMEQCPSWKLQSNSPSLCSDKRAILSQINPTHNLTFCLFNIPIYALSSRRSLYVRYSD